MTTATAPLAAPPAMMRCERLNMRLSTAACARLWRSAQECAPAPWEGRFHCRACPIGCHNSGEVARPAAAAIEALRRLCPRCKRASDRLVRDRLCVSCYNREREALRGRNAKGGRPRLCTVLAACALAVLDPAHAAVVGLAREDCAIDPTEVMLATARRAKGPLAFGRPGAAALGIEAVHGD